MQQKGNMSNLVLREVGGLAIKIVLLFLITRISNSTCIATVISCSSYDSYYYYDHSNFLKVGLVLKIWEPLVSLKLDWASIVRKTCIVSPKQRGSPAAAYFGQCMGLVGVEMERGREAGRE